MLSGRPFIGVPKITDNIIHPYHEIYAVRAGVACVVANGASSSFYLLDVCTEDPLPPSGTLDVPEAPGFRVEGIRAVSFDVDPQYRSITVWVLAEGDVAHSGRNSEAAAIQRIRNRWEPLIGTGALSDQVYYEDFRMTWRMRNVQGR